MPTHLAVMDWGFQRSKSTAAPRWQCLQVLGEGVSSAKTTAVDRETCAEQAVQRADRVERTPKEIEEEGE